MSVLRVGTRGSELALWQADWVCRRLREAHPSLVLEQVVIRTHGDEAADRNFGPDWPVGAFVSALEHALIEESIDLAVHSCKDLPTKLTEGLSIAATPARDVPHDVLLTKSGLPLEDLPPRARIGTNSPRRAAQMLRLGDFEIVPIRGNVPTRIARLDRDELDGIVLAAAGLKRLGINYPHVIELPADRFLPAPGQGALAVQAREGSEVWSLALAIDHLPTRNAVTAERSFLREMNAGCHTPAGALALWEAGTLSLRARLFSEDYSMDVEGVDSGPDPESVGARLARRLVSDLRALR